MQFSPLLEDLICKLQFLPGVGRKTAQRMAFSLLGQERSRGLDLAASMSAAMTGIQRCSCCRNYSDEPVCPICASAKRQDEKTLCVVENPSDVAIIEKTGLFQGVYFVLHGRISPLEGIGAEDIGLDQLERMLAAGSFKEVIVALNSSVEGNMTSFMIAKIAGNYGLNVTTPSRGIPVGSELDTMDEGTLSYSFTNRKNL
ncbi:MAG: recombination protein RecR [Succinivibrionaceae bacterium]|nr:recombination protein RecR [Succinivibrionaceae bacterium]